MKKEFSRLELSKWLKTTANITLLSVCVVNDFTEIITNISSPVLLSSALAHRVEEFPDCTYLVEYDEDTQGTSDDVPFGKPIFAIAFNASLRGGSKISNLELMLRKLEDCEYVVVSKTIGEKGSYNLNSIFIKQPEHSLELQNLVMELNEHASFVSVDDGRGVIELSNSYINGKKFT